MSEETGLPTAVEPAPTISQDLICLCCSYNLRGLQESGRCPECGEVIATSLRGRWLRDADRGWVVGMHAGVMVFLVAIPISVLYALSGTLSPMVWRWAPPAVAIRLSWPLIVLWWALRIGREAAYLWGTWRVAAPQPAASGVLAHPLARWARRLVLAANGLAATTWLIDQLGVLAYLDAGPWGMGPWSIYPWAMTLSRWASGLLGAMSVWCLLGWLGEVADRAEEPLWARRLRAIRWWLVGVEFATIAHRAIVLVVYIAWPIATDYAAWGRLNGIAGILATVAELAAWVFAVVLLFRVARILRHADNCTNLQAMRHEGVYIAHKVGASLRRILAAARYSGNRPGMGEGPNPPARGE